MLLEISLTVWLCDCFDVALLAFSERRFWQRSSDRRKKEKKGDGTLSGSGSSTPVPSSPRSSVYMEELDLCLPSQFAPVPSGSGDRKATLESVVQELVQSESVYVEELATVIKVRLHPPHACMARNRVLVCALHVAGPFCSPLVWQGYMLKFQTSPKLPDSLKDKKKMIFGYIKALHTFHDGYVFPECACV